MQNALILIQLLPLLIQTIKAVEEVVPVSGAGKEKLNTVISIMQVANDAVTQLVPQLTTIISSIVALMNATTWKKQ
jgi:hypothetical protein